MNPRLGDGDRLLFHDLMNGHPVDIGHLVEFVDAHHAPVGQDHGTCFETSFACRPYSTF
jgi:hypothetical protein